jgi:hypothetical protein
VTESDHARGSRQPDLGHDRSVHPATSRLPAGYDPGHGKGAVRVQGELGHKFWVARYGRYAIRIDANRPGVYRWLISLQGRTVREGVAPDRDQAAGAVSEAPDELPR